MALTAFRRAQIGQETTPGTAVAATNLLLGQMQVDRGDRRHAPQDDFASLVPAKRSYITDHMTQMQYQVDATYENILDFLLMCTRGNRNPTTPTGATNARLWTFNPRVDAANTYDTYTLEFGDEENQFQVPFVSCRSLEFGLQQGGPMTLRADLFGRGIKDLGAFASPAAIFTNSTPILADSFKVYSDDSLTAGVVAATASNLLDEEVVGGSVRLMSGLTPTNYLDGLIDGKSQFSGTKENPRQHNVDLDVVLNDKAKTAFQDRYEDQDIFYLRFLSEGGEIESGQNFTLDMHVCVYGGSGYRLLPRCEW